MRVIRLGLTIFLFSMIKLGHAQTDLYNSGTLYITGSSDILYINGGFTNANTSALTNNGSLYVRQNLVNNQASVAVGTGSLYLNGAASQTVSGTQPFNTFNLFTDNAAGITLNANLSVSGIHTFTNGLIATSATPNYLVYQAGASYAGATDARHVNGWVKKIGSTNFSFPLGNGTYLRSAAIENLSASAEFNARYYLGPTPNSTNAIAPLLLIDNNEYWDINRVSGGNAAIALNWDNTKVAMPNYVLSDIRVAGHAAGFWSNQNGSATGNVTTTGNITSSVIANFGFFTFGALNWTVASKLTTFTGIRKVNYSQLNWEIGKENNITQFDIERSDDGQVFRKIGNQLAITSNAPTHQYNYNDYQPINKNAWYRLRMVDRNNRASYSAIVMVSEKGQNAGLYVVNNPVYQNIYVSATGNYAGKYEYTIYSAAGQLIQKGNVNALGITAIQLSTMMTPGTYILDFRNSNHRLTQKIIVR